MLYSKSFIVLCFPFRFMIHFQLIFVKGARSMSKFIFFFFACGCPVALALFVEKTIVPPLHYFCFFVKDHLIVFMWVYFWDACYIPLSYLSVLSTIPHCLDYCGFRQCQSSNIILLLQYFVGYSGYFDSPQELQNHFAYIRKITCWDLLGIALNLQIKFGRTGILKVLRLLIHKHEITLYLFSSLILFIRVLQFPSYRLCTYFVRLIPKFSFWGC